MMKLMRASRQSHSSSKKCNQNAVPSSSVPITLLSILPEAEPLEEDVTIRSRTPQKNRSAGRRPPVEVPHDYHHQQQLIYEEDNNAKHQAEAIVAALQSIAKTSAERRSSKATSQRKRKGQRSTMTPLERQEFIEAKSNAAIEAMMSHKADPTVNPPVTEDVTHSSDIQEINEEERDESSPHVSETQRDLGEPREDLETYSCHEDKEVHPLEWESFVKAVQLSEQAKEKLKKGHHHKAIEFKRTQTSPLDYYLGGESKTRKKQKKRGILAMDTANSHCAVPSESFPTSVQSLPTTSPGANDVSSSKIKQQQLFRLFGDSKDERRKKRMEEARQRRKRLNDKKSNETVTAGTITGMVTECSTPEPRSISSAVEVSNPKLASGIGKDCSTNSNRENNRRSFWSRSKSCKNLVSKLNVLDEMTHSAPKEMFPRSKSLGANAQRAGWKPTMKSATKLSPTLGLLELAEELRSRGKALGVGHTDGAHVVSQEHQNDGVTNIGEAHLQTFSSCQPITEASQHYRNIAEENKWGTADDSKCDEYDTEQGAEELVYMTSTISENRSTVVENEVLNEIRPRHRETRSSVCKTLVSSIMDEIHISPKAIDGIAINTINDDSSVVSVDSKEQRPVAGKTKTKEVTEPSKNDKKLSGKTPIRTMCKQQELMMADDIGQSTDEKTNDDHTEATTQDGESTSHSEMSSEEEAKSRIKKKSQSEVKSSTVSSRKKEDNSRRSKMNAHKVRSAHATNFRDNDRVDRYSTRTWQQLDRSSNSIETYTAVDSLTYQGRAGGTFFGRLFNSICFCTDSRVSDRACGPLCASADDDIYLDAESEDLTESGAIHTEEEVASVAEDDDEEDGYGSKYYDERGASVMDSMSFNSGFSALESVASDARTEDRVARLPRMLSMTSQDQDDDVFDKIEVRMCG
jgi:hypothetical protein